MSPWRQVAKTPRSHGNENNLTCAQASVGSKQTAKMPALSCVISLFVSFNLVFLFPFFLVASLENKYILSLYQIYTKARSYEETRRAT